MVRNHQSSIYLSAWQYLSASGDLHSSTQMTIFLARNEFLTLDVNLLSFAKFFLFLWLDWFDSFSPRRRIMFLLRWSCEFIGYSDLHKRAIDLLDNRRLIHIISTGLSTKKTEQTRESFRWLLLATTDVHFFQDQLTVNII